jgi:zinc/manganese transport system substrate-binding protein
MRIVLDTMATMAAAKPGSNARPRAFGGLVLLVVGALALASCGSSNPSSPPTAKAGVPTHTVNIVAGENFWGSIVSELAGKAGNVTSIVTDPNADPHNYESSSNDARAFATADYVVLNGAGYDAWAAKLLSGNPNSKRRVFTVADLLGKKEGDNPHFWYNPNYVAKVTDQIEADLKSLDPADTAYFDAQRAAFDSAIVPVTTTLAEIRTNFAGVPVAATESIFVYLADYLGLDLISPPEFMQAVAEGNDPPAPSVALFQDQIAKRLPKVLVYNRQTSTVVTTNIEKQAAGAGIATIGVTETIQPSGARYEQWFEAEALALENALKSSAHGGSTSSAP